MRHSRRWTLALPVLCAALCAPAVADAQGAFSGKVSVRGVQATCLTNGNARGRVAIEAHVRYARPNPAAVKRYAGGTHRVTSALAVLDARGRVVARDGDRGSARLASTGRAAHVYVHKHVLGRAPSRALLRGRGCKAGTATVVRVRVRAEQRLGAPAAVARASAAAPGDRQAADVTTAAAVVPGPDYPVVNGCRLIGMDTNCHGGDLQGAALSGLALSYSDFSFAFMQGADLSSAKLGHVIMNVTNLARANMRGAQIGSASLTSAELNGTDLTGAAAPFANFGNATFIDAKLEDANLSAANLYGATFENTSCNAGTRLPAVFPFRCIGGFVAVP